MTNKEFDLISIGESLVEFSTNQKFKDAECIHKYYGGDSLVVAVSAKRLGSNVGFISCIGDDIFKDFLLESFIKENINTDYVRTVKSQNGIYMVSRSSISEKEFAYYRKKIAPAQLSIEDINEEYIKKTKIIYASGITQSLSISAREAVKTAFKIAKNNNVITAYDPNFSSLISTSEDAKEYFNEILPYTDVIFMSSKYDTTNIFETNSMENIVKTLSDSGISTVVIKSSTDKGYHINNNGNTFFTKFYCDNVIDTTSSGDAFNGAFLHALANGYGINECAKIASIDAGLQAQGVGAIKSTPYKEEVYNIYHTEAF